ncbi:hypothetical protein LZK73_08785 [Neorhizobium galegae]|nr:hypothetical protein LZK73_08785 [Neorhizobium galegae]
MTASVLSFSSGTLGQQFGAGHDDGDETDCRREEQPGGVRRSTDGFRLAGDHQNSDDAVCAELYGDEGRKHPSRHLRRAVVPEENIDHDRMADHRRDIMESHPVGEVLAYRIKEHARHPKKRRDGDIGFHGLPVELQEAGDPQADTGEHQRIGDLDGDEIGDVAAQRDQDDADPVQRKPAAPAQVEAVPLVIPA